MVKFFAKGINYLGGALLRKSNVFIGSSLDYLTRRRNIDKNYFDYVRLSTLELLAYEIDKKKIKGNVAELGVYKGKFARYINEFFPERVLYLFDTFEGFDSRDTKKEIDEKFSSGNQDFSDTSVEAVLAIMPHKQNCKAIKGFFPESAKGFNDDLVLVSIDADLFEPIYNGLNFFYPKLVQGGYILIHDFNNDLYKGARKAIEQFCREKTINFIPIPDSGGTAIITK
jgi:O-methyltransferase